MLTVVVVGRRVGSVVYASQCQWRSLATRLDGEKSRKRTQNTLTVCLARVCFNEERIVLCIVVWVCVYVCVYHISHVNKLGKSIQSHRNSCWPDSAPVYPHIPCMCCFVWRRVKVGVNITASSPRPYHTHTHKHTHTHTHTNEFYSGIGIVSTVLWKRGEEGQ